MEEYTELLSAKKDTKRVVGANPEVIRALLSKISASSNKVIKEQLNKSEISRRQL